MTTQSRRAREKASLREEILEAARALFVKDGYDHVSIRQIADKIHYAPGTIYLYFEDKEEIFRTICNDTFAKLRARMSAIAEDTCDPIEKLRRAAHCYVQFALEYPSHSKLVFMTRESPSELEDSTSRKDMGSACFGVLCHIVQQCIDSGALRSNDAQEVSQAAWACVHGVASLFIAKCGFPFIEQSRLIEAVVDGLLNGIRKPQSSSQ
jgi:AcrR family transcriptional regulator